jgi:hypothetical protein
MMMGKPMAKGSGGRALAKAPAETVQLAEYYHLPVIGQALSTAMYEWSCHTLRGVSDRMREEARELVAGLLREMQSNRKLAMTWLGRLNLLMSDPLDEVILQARATALVEAIDCIPGVLFNRETLHEAGRTFHRSPERRTSRI